MLGKWLEGPQKSGDAKQFLKQLSSDFEGDDDDIDTQSRKSDADKP